MITTILDLLHGALSVGPITVLAILAFGMFFNSAVMIPPSEGLCIYAGILAASRPASFLASAVFVLSLANLAGTYPWYWWGKRRAIREGAFIPVSLLRFVPEAIRVMYLDRLPIFLERFVRREKSLVFWTRLIPIFRSVVSYPAGYAQMSRQRFLSLSFVGIFIWVSGWILIGLIGGEIAYRLSVPIGAGILIVALGTYGFFTHARGGQK